jgi:hypothetical protein
MNTGGIPLFTLFPFQFPKSMAVPYASENSDIPTKKPSDGQEVAKFCPSKT